MCDIEGERLIPPSILIFSSSTHARTRRSPIAAPYGSSGEVASVDRNILFIGTNPIASQSAVARMEGERSWSQDKSNKTFS